MQEEGKKGGKTIPVACSEMLDWFSCFVQSYHWWAAQLQLLTPQKALYNVIKYGYQIA